MSRTVRAALAIMASVVLLAGCSSGPTSGPVSATVKEWQIDLSSTTLKAGSITFNITNAGDKEHEFVMRKTDLKSDKLPLNDAGEVSETATELTEVGDPSEVAEIKSGSSDRTLTVTLQPGHYVIFCNLHVDDLLHYQKGMHIDFTVE
ncbi:MAG: copper-binding protein [Chloroflexota bacterium]